VVHKITLGVLLLYYALFANSGSVVLYCKETNQEFPLVGVKIVGNTTNGQFITYTDSLGNFSFSSLPNGTFQLKIAHAGYETFTLTDSILPTQVTTANLFLRKVAYNDYEVVAYYKGEEKGTPPFMPGKYSATRLVTSPHAP